MHFWSIKCVPGHLEKLLASLSHLEGTRLVVTRTPGRERQLVQYFAESEKQAAALQKTHAGQVGKVSDDWQTATPAHLPIQIRNRFLIVEAPSTPPNPREIIIPAGLAFGTGDHPTTASCLRLLCDVFRKFTTGQWRLLDIGTGSGVLAIAARKLGAHDVAAFDYDPLSIRTARENARLNSVRGIRWSREDLLTFHSKTPSEVVTANIFSELFLATWPRIRQAINPNGYFILSGILRFQAEECRNAVTKEKFQILREVRLGKWVTFLAQSTGK